MDNVLVATGLLVHTIPKVASTSMSAAMLWKQPRRAYPTENLPGLRVMAVRHPLDRLVSAWRYFTTNPKARFGHDIGGNATFGDFLAVVLERPCRDRHTRKQVEFSGGQKIDRLVKLENLSHEWERLVGEYPVASIPHINRTDHAAWRSYYTPDQAGRALAVYRDDVRLYENAT